MIKITDDFLPEWVFNGLSNEVYCTQFDIISVGGKEFSVMDTPAIIEDYMEIEGYTPILSFIRDAWNEFDTEIRIHADNIILGKKTSLASVLYIDNDNVQGSGTAFYKHEKYGHKLPKDVSDEEFDELIQEDSKELDKWVMTDFISARPNRLVLYDSNYFHSKQPHALTQGRRIVLVTFYEKD